jgi:hypothetical protein
VFDDDPDPSERVACDDPADDTKTLSSPLLVATITGSSLNSGDPGRSAEKSIVAVPDDRVTVPANSRPDPVGFVLPLATCSNGIVVFFYSLGLLG